MPNEQVRWTLILINMIRTTIMNYLKKRMMKKTTKTTTKTMKTTKRTMKIRTTRKLTKTMKQGIVTQRSNCFSYLWRNCDHLIRNKNKCWLNHSPRLIVANGCLSCQYSTFESDCRCVISLALISVFSVVF
jgi:hypothetical protein